MLGTAGQLALKHTLTERAANDAKVAQKPLWASPLFLAWFVCYGASAVLWLIVLRTVPLSQAFPILGLQFALVPLVSNQFLREHIERAQWLGIAIIVIGVALVGQGQ